MTNKKEFTFVTVGGVPVNLNAGMIEAINNPPIGFVSKHQFTESDVAARVARIDWFAACGEQVELDLTMGIERVTNWASASASCRQIEWEDIELEAQNQLTVFLHNHDKVRFQKWNDIVDEYKETVLKPLLERTIKPLQIKWGLEKVIVDYVSWDILSVLMERAYLSSGHRCFFYHELLMVYEVGHFPCGWKGSWPQGTLVVY